MLKNLHALGQRIGHDGGGGGLDHRADLEVLVEGNVLAGAARPCIPRRSALAWFSSSRPEIIGYIILTLPSALARRMARSWARKMSRSCKRNANRAPAQERIQLGRHLHVGQELVAAQIEGADDHRQRLEGGGGLRDRPGIAAPRPAGARGSGKRYSVRNRPTPSAPLALTCSASAACSILAESSTRWPSSVTAGSSSMSRSVCCKVACLQDELAVLEERLVGGVDDDHAVEAIQQGVLAGLQLAADVLQTRPPPGCAASAP